jgi:hypothetical protein
VIRKLITRIKGGLTDLSDAERAQIQEAITMLRQHGRSAHLSAAVTGPRTPAPAPTSRVEARP